MLCLLAACSGDGKKKEQQEPAPAETLYQKAAQAMEEEDYKNATKYFEEVEVTREALEQKIDVVIGSLQANVSVVSLIFGCRKNNLLAEKADLKGKLKLINPLLEATFGVTIVGVGQRGARNNYRLIQQTLFTRDAETGRYMVASAS